MNLKRNHLLAGSLISALMLGACSSVSADTNLDWQDDRNEGKAIVNDSTTNSNVKMEAQQAVDKAKEQFDGEVQEVELDEDDGRYYYEVELQNGTKEYQVDLDANDLTILHESFDHDDDMKDDNYDDNHDDMNGDDNADDNRDDMNGDDNADDTTQSAPANGTSAGSAIISSTEALKIAQNEVGGEVSEWDYDEDDREYEVEIIANGEEHELTIDARTGDVVEFDD
ncbi:PepSY domain-containing protein [Salinicoccus sp. ID82-1]|uniref:PepSY domain-containing protein n=1 Tax=Salinicoccus sp. ID82-1 TaxID=2820269 RepID=UPI001F360730|nr:PepSY domain-containing protein [Salinicoccus sp. ID82-1]MCG1010502.1 PepSY domain-containing protein [Salinicoccus sp. ID82-1]